MFTRNRSMSVKQVPPPPFPSTRLCSPEAHFSLNFFLESLAEVAAEIRSCLLHTDSYIMQSTPATPLGEKRQQKYSHFNILLLVFRRHLILLSGKWQSAEIEN